MDQADAAFPVWSAVPLEDWIERLMPLLKAISLQKTDFAQLITLER